MTLSDPDVERLLRATFAATTVSTVSTVTDELHLAPAPASRPRRTTTWALPLAAAAAVVLVVGAFLVSRPATVPKGTVMASTQARQPLSERLAETAAKIEAIAHAQDPAFTEVSEIIKGTRNIDALTIYRAAPDPASLRDLYATVVPPGMTIHYARALLSERQQAAITKLVEAHMKELNRNGVQIVEWGGTSTGRYTIWYSRQAKKPDPALLQPFEIYGPGTVRFAAEDQPRMF